MRCVNSSNSGKFEGYFTAALQKQYFGGTFGHISKKLRETDANPFNFVEEVRKCQEPERN